MESEEVERAKNILCRYFINWIQQLQDFALFFSLDETESTRYCLGWKTEEETLNVTQSKLDFSHNNKHLKFALFILETRLV